MRHLGFLKADTLIGILNWVGLPLAIVYVFSMFIYPFYELNWNWGYVLSVWDRWQGLNVGMLAFVSSIVAFNISRFNAKKQQERNFLAAKAFLPAALSELLEYFRLGAPALLRGWEGNQEDYAGEKPKLPENYKEVFRECIRYAKPDVGDYLATILVRLQVHDSRLNQFMENFHLDKISLISYLYRLGELQALVNNLFGFARGEDKNLNPSLVWEDFHNAYMNLNFDIAEIYVDEDWNLEAFTKRRLSRENSEST